MAVQLTADHQTRVAALTALADAVGRARRELLGNGRTPQRVEIPGGLLEDYQRACRALYGQELEWFFQLPVCPAGPGGQSGIRVC